MNEMLTFVIKVLVEFALVIIGYLNLKKHRYIGESIMAIGVFLITFTLGHNPIEDARLRLIIDFVGQLISFVAWLGFLSYVSEDVKSLLDKLANHTQNNCNE